MKRGRLYAVYKVSGESADIFVKRLFAEGIAVKDCKAKEDGVVFTADFADSKKIFAISRNMCYNVRRVRYRGGLAFLRYALENVGLFVGFALFFALVFAFDGIVTDIEYVGDGEKLSDGIEAVLKAEGIKAGGFFTADPQKLAEKIFLSSDGFSFVSVKKSGRRLYVEAYGKTVAAQPLDTKKDRLISEVDGKVTKVTVMSGLALVSAGDKVKRGETLVAGEYEKDGKAYRTYVIAEIEIAAEYVFDYECPAINDLYEARAVETAVSSVGEKDIISTSAESFSDGEKNFYRVTVTCSVTVS